MALSESTLSTQLQTLVPSSSATEAALTLATAYGAYMAGAMTTGGTILPAAIPAAVAAMASAMNFSPGGDGAQAFEDGMDAFWAVMVAAPVTFFTSCTAITKPLWSNLGNNLDAVFGANVSSQRTLVECMDAIAAVLHAATDGQGTATYPGRPPVVIT